MIINTLRGIGSEQILEYAPYGIKWAYCSQINPSDIGIH